MHRGRKTLKRFSCNHIGSVYFIWFLLSKYIAEVFISPQDPTVTIGHPFSIECIVSTVTDLTSIKLYRSDPPQPICQVIKTDITENTTDVLCSGETTTTNGSLQIEFLSVQCSDEGDYICECNREASTPKRSRLYVTSKWLIRTKSPWLWKWELTKESSLFPYWTSHLNSSPIVEIGFVYKIIWQIICLDNLGKDVM